MPSASAKLEKQTSTETFDPVKQVLTIVEKKVRNLEKRKGKLDAYRQDSRNGKELNEDQKKAVEKYDQVLEILDFAKELQKQFQGVIQECSKAQKKAAKREQLERQQLELQRIKEIIVYQDLLTSMGGEDVRQDFLNGTNGAVKLSEEELNSLDELYKAICPERDTDAESSEFDQLMSTAAEHIQALLDSKSKEAFGTTYKGIRETLQKIQFCSYFNKSENEMPAEVESIESVPEDKDTKSLDQDYAQESDATVRNEVEDDLLAQQSGLSTTAQIDRPFYPMESSSLYSEQSHPIQEVLSVQGNLNFLQESQIEVEASCTEPQAASSLPGATYSSVQFSPSSQSMAAAASIVSQHRTRRPSEETMSSHPSPNIVLANSASLQQQVGQSIPASVSIPPTTQPIDFDPARPIPTQTYTNQSFSSAVHPMMAAVTQNYVPVVTLPHSIPPPHVLSSNMASNLVVQPLPPRSTVASSPLAANPNALSMAAQTSVSGLSAASALSQQANIYSLCLKMNQLNSESTQPSVTSPYECNEIQDGSMGKNSSASFGNNRDTGNGRESRSRCGSNAYQRGSDQVGYGNDTAYQSTNNSQAYISRDTYTDTSSYSSNLKRGLSARGGARGGTAPRGTNSTRGSRTGYRN
ncbi:caprin-1-like isoform X2 [Uloborus diversus]|uniref:caprin-1-like isoform X2 n=1 Tax=Uloborus diversus TaxID=327109 RepID=UPI0024094E1A|nr:caprin-1-like isoform X2 [Uloborus diversus]